MQVRGRATPPLLPPRRPWTVRTLACGVRQATSALCCGGGLPDRPFFPLLRSPRSFSHPGMAVAAAGQR